MSAITCDIKDLTPAKMNSYTPKKTPEQVVEDVL